MIKAPLLMGILNTTPDSFSDGGKFINTNEALEHALKMVEDGADIIDIGGESTRPGAIEIDIETELSRTIPIIKALREKSNVQISIDTRKPEIAKAAIEVGANIWNDVSALTFAPNSIEMAAQLNVPIILMHFQGTPENMQNSPFYRDVTTDVLSFLSSRIGHSINGGVKRNNLILDVGIGFGKSLEHNLELLANLEKFNALGCPILIGASRKSLIQKIDDKAISPDDRLGGSLAIALMAVDNGASIIRVHDVRQTHQAFLLRDAILRYKN